ncbi:MAG: pseudouridine synthase [Planctomycetaceae bacterium]|nr:pseudouridine synthase [Planctomycetaceae bacterium]
MGAKTPGPGRSRAQPERSKPGVSGYEPESESGKPERLQKILAHAGLGSRRDCEEYILQGRVTVDGKVVRELGTRVNSEGAAIAVDGERVRLEKMVYFAVNKPKGYVSTNNDPAGRPRVIDLLPDVPERVYAVGRLDEDSTGLMILTNDGELANRLAHPRYEVEKTYRALVAGTPGREILDKLTEGIWLSDGKVRAKRARFAGRQGEATTLELVLAEGKKHEIRRMLAKLGHKVMSLTRIAIGPVVLKGLSSGEHRPLSRSEIDLLRKVAAGIEVSPPRSSEHCGSRPTSTPPGPRRSSGRPESSEDRGPRGRSRNEEERSRRDRAPRAARLLPLPAREKPNRRDRTPGKPMPGKPMPGKPIPGKPVQDRSASAGPRIKPGQPVSPPGRKPSPTAVVKPAASMPPPGPRADAGKPPSSEARPARRVIGLDPKIAEEAGLSLSGRPARKRPAIARRPPRKVFGVRRSGEGEDER